MKNIIMPKSHLIKFEKTSKSNFIRNFFKYSLYEAVLLVAIISSILYNFFFWKIQYIHFIMISFIFMNGAIILLIVEHLFYSKALEETHYHFNVYLLIIALFFMNINFYTMMFKSIYNRIEIIDFISFTVNCTIGIGLLTFIFAKTYYFLFKYGGSIKKELVSKSNLIRRKPLSIKIAFLSSLLSILGLIIFFSMMIFQNNIEFISNVYYGKTVTVDELIWNMSELAFFIGSVLAVLNAVLFAEYYGCKKGWNRNLFPLTPFDKVCEKKQFYTLIAIMIISVAFIILIAFL